MPWTLRDVDSHCAGLSDKRKQVWVAVANGVLAECLKNGGTDKTCAPKAIRIANSRAKGANHKEVARMANANLSEVGKTISAATAAKLQAALQALENAVGVVSDLLGPEVADTGEAAREPAVVFAEAQKILATSGRSLDTIRSQVNAAVQDKFGKPQIGNQIGQYPWCRDIFPDAAVYELDGKLYRVAYTIDATSGESKVILGDPVEVEVAYVTPGEARQEAALDIETTGEFIPLIESALRADGSVPVKIIQPGQGSSGYYTPEVLKRDGPTVFKAGLKGYVDHPTESEIRERPERSVKDLALELTTNAHYDTEGAAGPGLYAEAKVYKPWQQFVSDMAPHIGLSIRATGKARDGEIDGKSTKIIEKLVSAKSVDLVTVPGAGGKILQLFESARERVEQGVQERAASEAAQGRDSTKGVSAMEKTQEVTALETALAEAKADATRAQSEATAAQAKLAEHDKAALKTQAAGIVAAVFAEAKVSPPEVLTAKLTATAPIKEGKLDADAFRAEVKAIAESMKPAATGGEIKGMGSGAETSAADDPAAHKALAESFERRFRNQGKKPDEAKQLAEIAARGR